METKIDSILKQFEKLNEENKETNENLLRLSAKVSRIEKFAGIKHVRFRQQVNEARSANSVTGGQDGDEEETEVYLSQGANGQLNNSNNFPAGSSLQGVSQFYGVATPQVDDLQAEFKAIQDSYSRVRIPGDLKFNGNKVGLKTQHKESANVISTCARYTETCLKILTHIQERVGDPAYMVNLQLQELYTCLYAMLRYLQEDHCALLVASNFGPRTQTLFWSI